MSAAEDATQRIRDAFVRGEFGPGDRLSADGLARSLELSHIPVREALQRLEAAGHVVHEPNRGYFVPQLTWADVQDIYHWRTILEDEALRFAAPAATPDDDVRIEALNEAMRAQVVADDRVRFHEINRRFHFATFEPGASSRLLRMLNHIWDAASHYQSVLIRDRPVLPDLQHDHDELVEAFVARDVLRLQQVMAGHRKQTLDRIRAELAQFQR